jgi:hypothetical protein
MSTNKPFRNQDVSTTLRSNLKFNFTKKAKPGFISIIFDENDGVPLYNDDLGYGFINQTCSLPARTVHTKEIISNDSGFVLTEPLFYSSKGLGDRNHVPAAK